jgi:tetratricopeptide (TPR) repeat protein
METSTTLGPAGRAGNRRDGYIYAFLFIVGVLPYLNTLWASFVYDDNYQIVENPYLRSFRYLKQILTTPVWSFKYSRVPTNYYRPLMSMEYLVLYKLYGPLAYVFHLANVFTHAAVVILLYAVTRRLFNSKPVAFVAAVLFALHPVHTEAVAWVAAVPDLQLAAFLLITFWFYLDLGEPGRNRWWTRVAMIAAFLLALFSKEPAVAFPVIALFYEYALRADRHETNWKQKLGRYGPLFLATGIYLCARIALIGGLIPKLQRPRLSWPSALLSAVSLFGQYMNKLVWPVALKMFYSFSATSSPRDPAFLIGVAWILGLGFLCWFLWKRNRILVLPILWTVATLAPALNARWMPGNVFAERYLYVPSIGFCLLAAIGLLALWDAKSIRPFVWARVVLTVVVLLALSLSTVKIVTRDAAWKNDLAFFKDGVKQNPDNANLRSDLGFAYWAVRDRQDAIEQWNISLAKDPNNFWALNNIGMDAVTEKRYTDAIPMLQRAIKMRPEFSDAHRNLAEAFEGLHRDSESETEYQAAIDSSPLDYDAHNRFAAFYREQGRVEEARRQYLAAFAAQPNAAALDGLGDIAIDKGQTTLAENYLRQAVGLDEYDHHAHYLLVRIYAESGRTTEALREFELGQRTDPTNDALGKEAKEIVDKLKTPR